MPSQQNGYSARAIDEKPGEPSLLPFSLSYPPYLNTRQRRAIYEAQIRGFIGAAEVVDLEDDVLADILDGFDDFDVEDPLVLVDGEEEEPLNVFGYPASMTPRWTPLEVKQMLKHLKERGMTSFVKEYISTRKVSIPELLCAFDILLCEELQKKKSETLFYFLKVVLSRELQFRERLTQYNTIDDAVKLISSSRRILILTGAGISVSCGIPDFRSRGGLYAQLKEMGQYDLDDPQEMFDIRYFRSDPAVFYSFAKQIYPSNFIPSSCHRFIKLVEDKGKLLRNYTQNIDTLETLAGVHNVLQCHGSFATASCLECRTRVPGSAIENEILAGQVPICPLCSKSQNQRKAPRPKRKRKSAGRYESDEDDADKPTYPPWVMKPDITFFGEKLTDDFEKALIVDEEKVDLILIMGTSLKVSPVADIINHLPHTVPQILINKTPVKHINPDIVLLGNADPIVEHLCAQLGWDLPPPKTGDALEPLRLNSKKRPSEVPGPERFGKSHVWLFDGAEGGTWLEELREREEPGNDSDGSDGDDYDLPPSSTASSARGTPREGTPREMKKPRID